MAILFAAGWKWSGRDTGAGRTNGPRAGGVGRLAVAFCIIAALFGLLDHAARKKSLADASVAQPYGPTQQWRQR